MSAAGKRSYVLSEIGPTAIGESANSPAATYRRCFEAPSVTSVSTTAKSAAIPHSAISVLKAGL